MIFWIFVILTFFGIAIVIATKLIADRNGNKFSNFIYYNDEPFICTGMIISIISGVIAGIMLIFIIISQLSADGIRQQCEQRYKALVYKSETESIRDEFGIVNKEYIDEVQAWNEDLAKYQSYSHNFWIGIFYPKRQFDGLEFIELKNIKMKE